MKWTFFLIILTIFTGSSVSAEEIESSLSSYPRPLLALMNTIPRWSPSHDISLECQKQMTPLVCRTSHQLNAIASLRSKLFFDFDLSPDKGFQKIDFQLTPSLKIRGLLGLHAGQVRPLVIFRMGIHGNRDEYIAERYILKILFEDLGYHVLTLESLTSHGFISSNSRVSFGGVEEGLHTFYILQQIRQHKFPWVKQISTLHLVALSMGGAGAFLTTYLDEQTFRQLSSVEMFCPLINLEENFAYLATPSAMNAFADYWNSMRLQALKDKMPLLHKLPLWKMLFDFKPRFAPAILEWLNQNQREPLLSVSDIEKQFPDVKFPTDFKKHLAESKNFYELNRFWSVFKNEKTPIQIITTPNDILVVNDLNSERIRTGQQPGIFHQVSFLSLDGFHCSLAEEYQWPFLVEVIRRGLEVRQ